MVASASNLQRKGSPSNIAGRQFGSRAKQTLTRALPLIVLLGLVGGISIVQPSFLSLYGFRVIAGESSPILLLSTGLTLVILIGGIDLSAAALASLASLVLASSLPVLGLLGIVCTLLMTSAVGALQGYVHGKFQVPSFIVTLAGMGLFSGAALTLSLGGIPVREGYYLIKWLKAQFIGIPISFLIALFSLAIVEIGLRFLPLGRHLYAVGLSEPASILSGVRPLRVKIAAFALCGLFSGLTALVLVAKNASGHPILAHSLLLPSIAAVVVGGTSITGGVGGLGRTLAGAIIVTVLRVGVGVVGIDPGYEPLAYGLIMVCAVALTIDRAKALVVK